MNSTKLEGITYNEINKNELNDKYYIKYNKKLLEIITFPCYLFLLELLHVFHTRTETI